MKIKKPVLIVGGVFGAMVLAAVIALMTFDVDTYRDDIIAMLDKQTGRTVILNGPIRLGVSLGGLNLSVSNGAISNPPWASRANMAGIGSFELGVAFLPLLSHRLEITHVVIANADIQLETNASHQHNWDFQPATGAAKPVSDNKTITKPTASSGNVAISLQKLSITDSQLALRGADGKVTAFKVKNLTFALSDGALALAFDGEDNGQPVTAKLKAETGAIMADKDWPFNLAATFAGYQLQANGTANLVARKANLTSYTLTSGGTRIHGQMLAGWATAVPRLQGNVSADKIDMADLKMPPAPTAQTDPDSGSPGAPAQASPYLISDAPLDLGALKSVDAAIDFSIGAFPVGDTALTQITGKVNLANGLLDLPFKARLGASELGGKIALNGASPVPQMVVNFFSPDLPLTEAFKAAGLPAFVSDSANILVNIGGAGNSLHAIAGNANGIVNIAGGGGKIDASAAGALGQGLAALFAPGGNSDGLNCLAARFIVTNGVVKDNGILVDTAPTTIAGKGSFNLRSETNDLTLRAKTKLANIGGVLPPLHIGGSFVHPDFSADTGAVVQNVVGMLTTGSLSSDISDVKGPTGQNACLYTLDHPAAASSNALLPASAGAAQLKAMGNQLLKGLFGK